MSPAEPTASLAQLPQPTRIIAEYLAAFVRLMTRPWSGLGLYTGAVIAAGGLLLAVFLPQALHVPPAALTGMLALGIATSVFKLSLRLPGGGATMTLGYAVGFLGLFTVGPHATAVVTAAGIWAQCTHRTERTTPMDPRRRLFSVACGVITVETAGWLFEATGGRPGRLALAPLSATAVAYFLTNTGLVAGAIALSTGQQVVEVWKRNFLLSGPSYFISAGVVALGLVVLANEGYLVALLLVVPLLLTYYAYRAYLGRIAEEQRQLQVARDHMESVMHSMNEMLLVVDPEGVVTTANAAACELLAYPSSDLVGRPIRQLLADGDDGDVVGLDFPPASARNVELRLLTRQGETIPVLFSSSPLVAGPHGTRGTVCVALDISIRKRAELAQRALVQRLQRQQTSLAELAREKALLLGDFEQAARLLTATAGTMMEASRADLRLLSSQGTLSSVDSYDVRTSRHSKEETISLDTAPGFADALSTDRVIAVTGATEDRKGWDLAGTLDGTLAWSVLHAPVRLGTVTVGVVTVSRFDTNAEWSIEDQQFAGSIADLASLALEARDRRHAQEELERSKDAAQAASLAKSAFVANMSHELRTPLNAIIGYCELLQEDAVDSGAKLHMPDLERIEKASKHLLGLVNDVLDFSKIEAGKITINPESFDPAALVRDAVTTTQLAADRNSNRLTVRIDGDLGTLYTDPRRLRQVLINLLGNACKFTSGGEVTISARRTRADGQDCLTLEVQDTGIGMSEDEIGRLFAEFSQADVSTTRRFGGTGLGLAISQRLCGLMGGSIHVESEKGVGSTFTVRVPVTSAPSTDQSM